ncbi:hypothetical protein GQ53DRAFT_367031 [Thozetella sp. PMI_491]|nr:hypothetical protein GQ53DRAFT_367031 [Thozetella sp. PMI_491]
MATAVKTLSVEEQLQQLNAARKIVLENPPYYDKIVKGTLPILQSPFVELRRWGADFLAESLATPVVSTRERENLTLAVLHKLQELVDNPNEDTLVLKSSIMAAATAYPVIMRWIINNSYHKESWEQISMIKARILRIWDGAPAPVKVCCIKFAQRVVLAQTTSNGGEQKYLGLDVSLSMIPPGHPILDPRHLEAEGMGLLDRMLSILQDNSSDALLVDATLNTLSILIRTRPGTSNRIVNAVLNFNPLKLANSPMTPKSKVLMRSMEKTTRMLFLHLIRRDPHNPLNPRMQQYVERMVRSRAEMLDDASRKRALGDQASYVDPKRQRIEGIVAPLVVVKPLPTGPQSLASVFNLANNPSLQAVSASQIPLHLAITIAIKSLASVSQADFDRAINGVRDRLKVLEAAQPSTINAATAPLGVDDDDDDEYEPDFHLAEDTEQILNKLDSGRADEPVFADPDSALAALGPFKLPPPPTLDPDTAAAVGTVAVSRMFGPLASLEDPPARKSKAGIHRLAASSYDRDSWLVLITRLATRTLFDLEEIAPLVPDGPDVKALDRPRPSLSNAIREKLYAYVLEDFRRRIDTGVTWLSEEWYSDQLARRSNADAPLHYATWATRLIDGLLPYITQQDKVLTRFLGDLPELSRPLLGRIKPLCKDPSTVSLALTSLLYLVMMRPPAKDMALDVVAEIWMEFEDARPMAAKYLAKYRPDFLKAQQNGGAADGPGHSAAALTA